MFAESDKFFYPGILPYLRKRGNKSHDDTHHADHKQACLPVLRRGSRKVAQRPVPGGLGRGGGA